MAAYVTATIESLKTQVTEYITFFSTEAALRVSHLEQFYGIANKAYVARALPAVRDVPFEVLITTFFALIAVNIGIASLTKKGREFLGNIVNMVLVVVLTVFLVCFFFFMFVGVPIYLCYLAYHGVKKVFLFIVGLEAVKPYYAQLLKALEPYTTQVATFIAPYWAIAKPYYVMAGPWIDWIISFF